MTMDFNSLTDSLSLTGPERLDALADWCQETICSDCLYGGSTEEQYEAYLDMAEDYLDNFLVNLPVDPVQSVPGFNDLNTIQYAALRGYDRWLAAQTSVNNDTVNIGNEAGMTPLHLAALGGHLNTVDLLLARGASAHQVNRLQQYPIYSSLLLPILADDELKTAKMAIYQRLNSIAPDTALATDVNGDNLAHVMAIYGYDELCKCLLEEHRDLFFQANNHSHYPIHSAILNAHPKVVTTLLAVEGMARLTDARNQNALHYAARYGNAAMMDICCAQHPDFNAEDSAGKTALMLATEARNVSALEVLKQYLQQDNNLSEPRL